MILFCYYCQCYFPTFIFVRSWLPYRNILWDDRLFEMFKMLKLYIFPKADTAECCNKTLSSKY